MQSQLKIEVLEMASFKLKSCFLAVAFVMVIATSSELHSDFIEILATVDLTQSFGNLFIFLLSLWFFSGSLLSFLPVPTPPWPSSLLYNSPILP
jgi:hypothetical protein